jgi:hypothetical protein
VNKQRLAPPTEARELSKYNGLRIGLGQELPIESQYIPASSPKPNNRPGAELNYNARERASDEGGRLLNAKIGRVVLALELSP